MRILIIEDEFNLADVISDSLKKQKYQVDIRTDGEEGYFDALTGIYDLIILDVMLPHMNGFDILKGLREEEIKSKVIMLTAKSELSDKLNGFEKGANDYLAKPFSTPELLARVRALTRRGGEATPNNEMTLGNTTLNLVTFSIKGPLGEATLINKEFQLLLELLRKPGLVHSVYQLLDKIWGLDSEVYDDVVWVNISYVRKKLKSIGSNIEIKTKRNLGYYVEVKND